MLVLGLPGLDPESLYYFQLLFAPWIPLVAMLWLWGVNVQHWTEMRGNYARVFNQVRAQASPPPPQPCRAPPPPPEKNR